tara:strand:+ start:1601 stop:1801 length:201 start_codon:yes stop_codon:yes gene_type:complete
MANFGGKREFEILTIPETKNGPQIAIIESITKLRNECESRAPWAGPPFYFSTPSVNVRIHSPKWLI